MKEKKPKKVSSRYLAFSTGASSALWQLYLQFEVKLCQRKVAIVEQSKARVHIDASVKETLKEAIKKEQRQCKAALTRAKLVFYRAIQSVPYCKGEQSLALTETPSYHLVFPAVLYMTAFTTPLRLTFPLEELLQISQVMQKRQLRLYTDLTAFITPTTESSSTTSQ